MLVMAISEIASGAGRGELPTCPSPLSSLAPCWRREQDLLLTVIGALAAVVWLTVKMP